MCVDFFKGYNPSQMCDTADSFLSAKRAESSGCDRSLAFPPVDGEWFSLFLSSFLLSAGRVVVVKGRRFSISGWGVISLSLSLFLKKKKKRKKVWNENDC